MGACRSQWPVSSLVGSLAAQPFPRDAGHRVQVRWRRDNFLLSGPLTAILSTPIEQEGTYPLPEAQLDRFMFELHVEYPSRAEEESIVERTTGDLLPSLQPVLAGEELIRLQRLVRRIPAPKVVVEYAVRLARMTRPADESAPAGVKEYVSWGAGPRASQYMVLGAKARAAMDGRPMADLEDVDAVALAVLRHRVVVNFNAEAAGKRAEEIAADVMAEVRRRPGLR